jgi:hypothetical protein
LSLELSDNVLNRYKVLQDQSSKRERRMNRIIICFHIAIQQSSISNLAYVKSKLTGDYKSKNLSTSKMALKQQYRSGNNNMNNSCIHDSRTKSCQMFT